MDESQSIQLTLELQQDYQFSIRFEGAELEPLLTDEPPPLGEGSGPNPSQLLLAAIANCLSASLLFAMRKFRNEPARLRATVTAVRERNAAGRWRIPRAEVTIHLPDAADDYRNLDRILAQFEEFCIVTQSVREGIEVTTRIEDANGLRLRALPAG
ncbi:MAG TPA: OsmC family protein [Gammaproteobacteria bacterium]|nr:OsmC family protein [Gammaproteobacteria bacterium]HRP86089.1 OsmC family protein [Gammaproteobacteria bacterium]